ncbi:LuxR family transcriptional regulator [Actinoplanes sp. N902-109]|uniref:helix-turn-helix transcriptional regulator n=1 Tax=Actinoplanes sp. (strain N902-109) TaxID=649831 RepID=UPI000329603C|nr:LuxR family transcriptional regulator [Actinoplanes sp. N902-109]AGL16886.1 LuxR family transcriptional regulator [Actinoplanes sp. N902-109]
MADRLVRPAARTRPGPGLPLVGRDRELATIAEALRRSEPVLVTGARGTGRSAVLAAAARSHARATGLTVLATGAVPRDEQLPGAALQRLLAPVPELSGVLAGVAGVREMAGALAEHAGRWLWCVDDLDRIDEFSRVVVLAQHGVPVLAGATTPVRSSWRWHVRLDRLTRADAERLLATLPGHDHPAARLVLAQAAGNPLALTELARTLPALPADLPAPTATELPLPDRLRHALAAPAGTLDAVLLRAAVLAAVAAETPGRPAVAALDTLAAPAVWSALAAEGVLRPGRQRRFVHPVMRAAVLERAGFAPVGAARRELVAALPAGHPAQAWHTARAEPAPDATTADLLDRAASGLIAAGRPGAAAYALALAAERSTGPGSAHDRRLRAAHCAERAGAPDWGRQLAAGSPPPGGPAGHGGTGLLRLAYLRGDDQSRDAVRAALPAGADEVTAAWVQAVVEDGDPDGRVRALLTDPAPTGRAGGSPGQDALTLGTLALARHETAAARRHLTRSLALARPGSPDHGLALSGLVTVEWDAGDLTAAAGYAARLIAVTRRDRNVGVVEDVRASARATLAAIAVLRDDADRDRRLREARDELQPGRHALYALRLDRAQGLADSIRGRPDLAFHRLRRHFHPDGRPVHHRGSDLALADLARVAAGLGRGAEVAPIVEAAGARVRRLGSARVTALWLHARALLAGPAAAPLYQRALAGGGPWAVERALTMLDYAQWLRRGQRPAESRPLLTAARAGFTSAGLGGWRERAQAELDAADPPRRTGPVPDGLTPQQRQVVTLAAQGLTNPQIAARLGLSARTVGTHLSRAYPVLGVTRRSQLPAVLDTGGTS